MEELPSNNVNPEPEVVEQEVSELVDVLVVELSRQELYDKIWELSVAGVAKEIDIPYPQLMKQVKASNIPIPPSGYWTKLSFGKPVEKILLNDPTDAVVSLYKSIKTIIPYQTASVPSPQKVTTVAYETKVKQSAPAIEDSDEQKASIVPEESFEPVETFEQYGQTYNIYNREKLYQEIWEKPVTEVAKRYKVSDVAIHKVCKALDIPTPGLGYWAKVRAGKPVKQTPLPKSEKHNTKVGMRTNLEPQPRAAKELPQVAKELLQFLPPEDKSIVLSVAMQIMMPDENAKMHTKIISHRKKVVEWHKENRKHDQYRNRRNTESQPFLADTVSETTLPRVCRIIDALIKALEPLGCSLTNDLRFVVNGETVSISISESKDKIDHVPTREENIQLLAYEERKRRYSWESKPNIRKYDHVYNGRISLIVENEKSFRDCKSYVIEDRLGDILVVLYEASNEIRIRRELKEAEERKRQEEARLREERRERYNIEIEHTKSLVNEAKDYSIACQIRAYVSAIEQKDILSEQESEWISWAKQKADWYDPTIKRGDEFLGIRKHSEDSDKKKLEKSYSSWRW